MTVSLGEVSEIITVKPKMAFRIVDICSQREDYMFVIESAPANRGV